MIIPFQLIGFSVLFGIVFLVALKSLCCDCCKCCCSRRAVYDRVILEQAEEVLKETLREAAKEQLTKRIFEKIDGNSDEAEPAVEPGMQNKDEWIKNLRNIAVEIIEGSEKPVLSKQQKKQWNDLQEVPQAQGEQQVEDD